MPTWNVQSGLLAGGIFKTTRINTQLVMFLGKATNAERGHTKQGVDHPIAYYWLIVIDTFGEQNIKQLTRQILLDAKTCVG